MTWAMRKQLTHWGITAAIVLLITVAGLVTLNALRLVRAFESMGRVHALITNLYETDSLLDNAHLAVTTYLLHGKSGSLSAYQIAEEKVPLHLGEFKRLNNDPAFPPDLVRAYETGVARLLALYPPLIEHYLDGRISRALRTMEMQRDDALHDENDRIIRELQQIAWKLLAEREAAEKRALKKTLIVATIGGLIGLALLWIVYQLLQHEIRRREQVEADLRASQAARLQSEKMASVGVLASGMAHEINNPMGVILGFAQAIGRRLRADDPLSTPVKSIERESVRVKNLVQDLLTFSRTGQEESHQPVDLRTILETVLPPIEERARAAAIRIDRSLDSSLPPIMANRIQIQQIVQNLCANAIDAMPQGGVLTLGTRRSPERNDCIDLQIGDTGMGIPEDIQTRIFEPFFTTKEIGKGTGLGLSVVYEIVQKHHGAIQIQSTPGRGSLFTITLPIQSSL